MRIRLHLKKKKFLTTACNNRNSCTNVTGGRQLGDFLWAVFAWHLNIAGISQWETVWCEIKSWIVPFHNKLVAPCTHRPLSAQVLKPGRGVSKPSESLGSLLAIVSGNITTTALQPWCLAYDSVFWKVRLWSETWYETYFKGSRAWQ